MISHKFTKTERLKHKKHIALLFSQGKTWQLPLLRLYYLPCHTINTHQVLFSVPKKMFKKAVRRNAIKRKIREAYRISKHSINNYKNTPIHFLLAYIYVAKHVEKPTYQAILADLQRSMLHLQHCLQQAKLIERN